MSFINNSVNFLKIFNNKLVLEAIVDDGVDSAVDFNFLCARVRDIHVYPENKLQL